MNYKNHYDRLISRARNHILQGYVEKHHIIPKCLGGTNDKDNIVELTPEETKRKMSEAKLGKPKTEEHKLKISLALKGREKYVD